MNNVNTSILNNQLTQLRKEIAEQDAYRAFALNANNIAPQQARGYLVKDRNPFSSMVIAAADTGKDVVELGKALATGKSNDNQLGRFNDLGMKLGGLGIASYLFTRRGTGTKGLMEFLGFGAFFGVMAAWPRVLISEPMKHRFGFDFRQKYIDSQGRKKYFFQDNQYQPWDMWSKEELNKVGDKLNIPKDTLDRENIIKEKMRAIALQGNTLWMLSAGFSPVLTSMVCNVGERAVTKSIVNHRYNKVLSQADNLDKIVQQKIKDKSFDKDGAKVLNSLLEGRVAEPDITFFRNASMELDPFKFVRTSLKDIDDSELNRELASVAPSVKANLQQTFESLKSAGGAQMAVKHKDLVDKITKEFHAGQIVDSQGNNDLAKKICRSLLDVLPHGDNISTTMTVEEYRQVFKNVTKDIKNPDPGIMKRLESFATDLVQKDPTSTVDKETLKRFYDSIGDIYSNQTRQIGVRMETISEFINSLVGQKYESVNTSIHLDSVKAFMHELKPSSKDLKAVVESTEASQNYLVRTLGTIADNDTSYGEFISSLSKKQAQFDAKIFDKVLGKITKFADDTFAPLFSDLPEDSIFGFLKKSVKDNTGLYEAGGAKELASAKPLYRKVIDLFIEEKGAGIKATNHRYLLAADFEKRVSSGLLKEQWLVMGGKEDAFKKILDMCREVVYNSTMNDLSNKFYLAGQGDEAAKVISLVYDSPMHDSTFKNCDDVLYKALVKTRDNIKRIYAQVSDLARPGHNIKDLPGVIAGQKTQYSMIGKSVTDLFYESAKKRFNDKHWMKIFGGLAIGVTAATLIAPMFFGKTKDDDLYKKDKKVQQGGVNAAK